jgi:hypothetical protein
VDEGEKIQQIFIDLNSLRDNVNRLLSNAISEKENYREKHIEINKRISDLDKLIREIFYDADRGFMVRVDRLKQQVEGHVNELIEIKEQVRLLNEYMIEQKGIIKVAMWFIGIGIAILVGITITLATR